mgnify:CR=1 FL=1
MRLTTTDQRLNRTEVATTALAVVASTGLYLRYRHPYLARGVVGDIAGLAVCSVPLITSRRRLRHEALVCLTGIGAVYATTMRWPLRFPEPFWWSAIAIALTTYVPLRRLARRPGRPAR